MHTMDQPTANRPTTASRVIGALPQLKSAHFTPNKDLDFDQSVREFCHNGNHDSIASSNGASGRKSFFERRKSTQIYDLISASSSRVTRSCKVILSGDVSVGKTNLINRFARSIHSSVYQTTIGVDFDLQRFKILNQPYMLQIWDTAGLERFKCINSAFYRGCQVALLVFDVSNMRTLADVLGWRDEVLAGDIKQEEITKPLFFLVGTKYDLPLSEASKNFVEEQANKIAQLLGAELWFVSSLTGQNVDELFNRIAALAFNRCILDEIHRSSKPKPTTTAADSTMSSSSVTRRIIQQTSCSANKLIKVTRKKSDKQRSQCVNVRSNLAGERHISD